MTTSGHAQRPIFRVEGLDCADEVTVPEREVGPLVGGEEKLRFDILNGRMVVLGPDPRVTARQIETADIALMTDDLGKLPWLVRHSRRMLAIMRQNIAFSPGVKAAFVVSTFAGHATPWGAIAADVGASLLVVANALRLSRAGRMSGLAADQ